MNLILIGLAIFVSAYIIHLIWSLCRVTGWSDEQSLRMIEELDKKGERIRKKYQGGRNG